MIITYLRCKLDLIIVSKKYIFFHYLDFLQGVCLFTLIYISCSTDLNQIEMKCISWVAQKRSTSDMFAVLAFALASLWPALEGPPPSSASSLWQSTSPDLYSVPAGRALTFYSPHALHAVPHGVSYTPACGHTHKRYTLMMIILFSAYTLPKVFFCCDLLKQIW